MSPVAVVMSFAAVVYIALVLTVPLWAPAVPLVSLHD